MKDLFLFKRGLFSGCSGAGADFVMLGGMLAGHSESGGEIIEKNGKNYKLFYGMSSDTAMKKHAGGVAEYRSESPKFWYDYSLYGVSACFKPLFFPEHRRVRQSRFPTKGLWRTRYETSWVGSAPPAPT